MFVQDDGSGRAVSLDHALIARLGAVAREAADAFPHDGLIVASVEPPSVLWANKAAQVAFGLHDREALTAALFATPAARGFKARLKRLTPGGPESLERLQVFSGFGVRPLTVICGVPAASGENAMAVLRLPGAAVAGTAPEELPLASTADSAECGGSTLSGADAVTVAGSADTGSAAGEASVEAAPPQSATEALAARFAPAKTLRFVWECDASGRFTAVGAQWADCVGTSAPQPGQAFAEALRALSPEAAATVEHAMGERRSWSGVAVWWPIAGTNLAVAIDFGGAPSPGRSGGFRGFGLIHVTRTTVIESEVSAAPGPAEDSADDGPSDLTGTPEPAPAESAVSVVAEPATGPSVSASEVTAEALLEAEPVEPLKVVAAETTVGSDRASASGSPSPSRDTTSANVVNLLMFRASGQLGAVGGAVPRPGPRTVPNEPEPEPAPDLEPPRWSESPDGDFPVTGIPGELSPVERLNLQEIRRALGAERNNATIELAEALEESGAEPAEGHEPAQVSAEGTALPDSAKAIDPAEMLLDRLPLGVVIAQADELKYVNRAALDLLGFDSLASLRAAGGLASILGSHPADDETFDQIWSRPGAARPTDVRMHAIDWNGAAATLLSIRGATSGEASARAEAIRLDLTRSQQLVEDLTEALDLAACGVTILDGTSRILTVNAAAEAFFGYDQKEIAGEDSSVLIAPDQKDLWSKALSSLDRDGDASRPSADVSLTGRKRNGAVAPLRVRLRRSNDGRICAVWIEDAPRDVVESELDSARREAERSSSLKSEFLAKVSHEIRTPLNAILGFAEVMRDERLGPVGNERYKEYLRDIHASGTHVMSLVNDLLDLSRIEAGRLDLKIEPVNANTIVSDCVATLQTQAHRERIILRLSLAPRLPHVLADERALRQIILNLLSNAVKFNEPGGQVIISTALIDSASVAIRIRDTGFGMSEDDIAIAMEPFRQLATPKASAGTGLGLPLTKALVDASHASMAIKSRPREGTLVEVVFQTVINEAVSVPAE